MYSTIKQVLIERDGMTEEDAEVLIEDAKEQLQTYLDEGDEEAAENICDEYFSLEPDYIVELT